MTLTTPHLSCANLWASNVAQYASLCDKRLDARFALILATLAAKPLDSFTQAAGSWGQAKAIYRFFSNKRIQPENLLLPITRSTVAACRGLKTILAVQDTTSLNYSSLRKTKGLGPINDSARAQGLHLHSTLAVRLDGLPIGALDQIYWSRPADKKTAPERRELPIEQKESFKWLRAIRAATDALEELPASERPHVIHVMDREGDIHEVLEEITERGQGGVIRCAQNRSVAGDIDKAHQAVAASDVLGNAKIHVPASKGQSKRTAQVELRATSLTITPNPKKHPNRHPVTWTLVEVREFDAPAGVTPLRWLIWTTEPAGTKKEILEILRIYKLRWIVEDFHLTLKSGCRAEALELEDVKHLKNALTVYSAVALRIVALRDTARLEPDAPCDTILSEYAWKALWTHFHKKAPAANTPVPTVREAIQWIGRLGGHLARKHDGMPGVRTLWRGWRDLSVLVAGFAAGLVQK